MTGPGDRLAPGATLRKRYRIVGHLGSGGMGEVYRADDLELGQSVALKFLPPRLAADPAALARFRNEVRLARQIAHPNVCRVFDIGEAGGRYFLSMEYVDGEDLASVLRRLGRPSKEKCLQIARQLCAGLAAAHDNGVLHRDLKPANIMIDGRGRVRITDFGLAALAEEVVRQEGRVGTPAYMAPEQLSGERVSVRSDLYSLGLVLYELFTGKRVFEGTTAQEVIRRRESSTLTPPSWLSEEMDPVIERIIVRCLEREPPDRPPSALSVAAALPGGDPLAEALAAGETPSPELLAASGKVGALQPAVAVPVLAAVLLGLGLVGWLNDRVALYRLSPFEKAPQVLADRAAEIVRRFGYTDQPADEAYGFDFDDGQLEHIAEHDSSPQRWRKLAVVQPAPIRFWYRQSPMELLPTNIAARVRPGDPPFQLSGMCRLWLDATGRLQAFNYQPPQVVESWGAAPALDWSVVFREAGLDISMFNSVEPEWTPLTYADERRAWVGSRPGAYEETMRVEAAAFQGRPVYFVPIYPFVRPGRAPSSHQRNAWMIAADWLGLTTALTAMIVSVVMARRNLRAGRGDRNGALRVAMFLFMLMTLGWFLGADHAGGTAEFDLFIHSAGSNLFICVWLWLMYLALEPYARRHWPGALIAWSRLIAGRFRDPLVGRSVLIGALAGVVATLSDQVIFLAHTWLGYPPPWVESTSAAQQVGRMGHALGAMLNKTNFIIVPMMALFLVVVAQLVLRRSWLSVTLVVLVLGIGPNLLRSLPRTSGAMVVLTILETAVPIVLGAILLFQFGLPALMTLIFVDDRLSGFPVTIDSTAWYSGYSYLILAVVAVVAVYGFVTALGGRSLFAWADQAPS